MTHIARVETRKCKSTGRYTLMGGHVLDDGRLSLRSDDSISVSEDDIFQLACKASNTIVNDHDDKEGAYFIKKKDPVVVDGTKIHYALVLMWGEDRVNPNKYGGNRGFIRTAIVKLHNKRIVPAHPKDTSIMATIEV